MNANELVYVVLPEYDHEGYNDPVIVTGDLGAAKAYADEEMTARCAPDRMVVMAMPYATPATLKCAPTIVHIARSPR